MKAVCDRCKRRFKNTHARGAHQRAYREAVGPAARVRICPDNRSEEQAREEDGRLARLRGRFRQTGADAVSALIDFMEPRR